jgi:hypothetical protein
LTITRNTLAELLPFLEKIVIKEKDQSIPYTNKNHIVIYGDIIVYPLLVCSS